MEKASPQQEGYVNNKCYGSYLALCTNWCDMWIRDNGANKVKANKNNTNRDKRLHRKIVACEKRFPLPLKVLYIT